MRVVATGFEGDKPIQEELYVTGNSIQLKFTLSNKYAVSRT
jgi:hypothetical protein